jgi:hypothetical protein
VASGEASLDLLRVGPGMRVFVLVPMVRVVVRVVMSVRVVAVVMATSNG